MKENDKVAFLEIMTGIAEVYEMDMSKAMLGIWFAALGDYTVEEVRSAATRYVKSPDVGKFKPKPADFIKMLSGTSQDLSMLAWTKVDKAVRMIGTYRTVVFDDPIIHRVINDMGGWCQFGNIDETEWPFKAKEFQLRYRVFSSMGEIPEHPKQLTGEHDNKNRVEGFGGVVSEPVFIGDIKKAMMISGCSDQKRIG